MKQKKEELSRSGKRRVKIPDKKEAYKYHDRDDLDYYGIRDVKIYLVMLMLMMIISTNQYQSKFLLRIIINIKKAEEIKTKSYK